MVKHDGLIRRLDEIDFTAVGGVGGKTAGLWQLMDHGIRVPPGWVIPCEVFTRLCEETDENWGQGALLLQADAPALQRFQQRFRDHCRKSERVKIMANNLVTRCNHAGISTLAVRSSFIEEDSSENAYPGVFATVLDVSTRDLRYSLVECWASTFAPEAIDYLKRIGRANEPVAMAVIVQKMIHGRLSGVAFSKDPIAGDPEVAVIEFVEGGCAQLVDGTVTPRRLKLHERWMPNPPEVLPETAAMLELMEILRRIDGLHPTGADIEWTVRENEIYVLQCRPITTRPPPYRYAFSARNATSLWAGDAVFNRYFDENTIYCRAHDQTFVLENNYFERYIGLADRNDLKERGYRLLDDGYFEQVAKEIEAANEATWSLFRTLETADYERLPADGLIGLLAEISQVMNRSLNAFKMSSARTTEVLFQFLTALVGERDAGELAMYTDIDLIDEEALAAQNVDPDDPESCRAHLSQFPWLASNCATLEQALSMVAQRCVDSRQRNAQRTPAQSKSRIRDGQRAILRTHELNDAQLGLITKLHRLGLSRLQTKTGTSGIEYYAMGLLREIGRRHEVDIDTLHRGYFLKDLLELLRTGKRLSEDELARNAGPLLIQIRENDYRVLRDSGAVERFQREHVAATLTGLGAVLKGYAACRGMARGRAVNLKANDQNELAVVRDTIDGDCILVCDMLQPNASDLIARVAGVVTDEGGVLSHAAIMAREFEIPCVVGVGVATKLIRNGEMIIVVGDEGEVIRAEGQEAS